jgi:hypothetical protein
MQQCSTTELYKGVMTAAFPLHIRTAPLVANLLSDFITKTPESLPTFITEVFRFLLYSIRSPPLLTRENGLLPLLDVIFANCNINLVIDGTSVNAFQK